MNFLAIGSHQDYFKKKTEVIYVSPVPCMICYSKIQQDDKIARYRCSELNLTIGSSLIAAIVALDSI
jgi:hypothetical protein